MPIKGDILSSSFAPQIDLFNTSNGTNKIKGGITEYIKAEYNIRLFWYAEPSTFSVFSNGAEIRRNDGRPFLSDGFDIGGQIDIRFGFGSTGQNGVGTISAISQDGFTLFSTVNTLTNGEYGQDVQCLICGINSLDQADFQFGLLENNESFNTFSKVTGEDQKYYVENLQTSTPIFGTIAGTIKGWASSIDSISITKELGTDIPINRPVDFGGTGGNVRSGSVLNYNIKHQFPLLPYYTVGQLQNIKDLIAPSFLAGNKSLKHSFEATFKTNISDSESNKKVIFDTLEGSVGFFNENFNGLQSQYAVIQVQYFDNSSNLPNDSLLVDDVTKVLITLRSENGTFTTSTPVIASHSYLPFDEDEYIGSQNFYNENFAFESIPKGAGGSIIKSVTKSIIDVNTLEVSLLVDVSNVLPELTEESNYLLAITVQDETLSPENSDRTTLLVDVNNYDKSPDIPDLLFVNSFKNYDHTTDISDTGNTDYKGWVQDGYAVEGNFSLDRSKFAFLNTLSIDIVAWNNSTNEFFTLQTNDFNISNSVISEGNQQINIDTIQGFRLDVLDQFNQKKLTTGTFDGTFIEYDFLLGLKINWQDWLLLPDADTVFYNPTEPNNGLNQNASRYNLKEGYELKTILRANVLETVQNIVTEYIHKSNLESLDFGEIVSSSVDWSGTITTKRDDTGADANGKILSSGSTIITATFTPNFAITPVVEDFEGIIRIVETLPQSDKTIFELSSVRSSQANNLLIPLAGEALTKVSVVGSNVILECRTDETIVENINYTLSARLIGEGEVILGDYNDDFSNDFFV